MGNFKVQISVAVLAIAANLASRAFDMHPLAKKIMGISSLVLGGIAGTLFVWGVVAGPGDRLSSTASTAATEDAKSESPNTQDHPVNSPLNTGDNNQFNYGLGANPKSVSPKDESSGPQDKQQVKPEVSKEEPPQKPSVDIKQINPRYSPPIVGNHNQVIIHPDQDRRITKEDEFVRALRVVGPGTIGLEAYDERETLFLYGQLYNLLIASKWTADERATVRGQSWVGVHVVIQKDKAVPPGAKEMVKQLRANGIDSWLVPESNSASFGKVNFIVRVGFRPSSNNQ